MGIVLHRRRAMDRGRLGVEKCTEGDVNDALNAVPVYARLALCLLLTSIYNNGSDAIRRREPRASHCHPIRARTEGYAGDVSGTLLEVPSSVFVGLVVASGTRWIREWDGLVSSDTHLYRLLFKRDI